MFGNQVLKRPQVILGFSGGSVVKNPPAVKGTWVWSLGQKDPLQESMATHSSILAWRIPSTEEPGRLQPMKLQKSWTPLRIKQQQRQSQICKSGVFPSFYSVQISHVRAPTTDCPPSLPEFCRTRTSRPWCHKEYQKILTVSHTLMPWLKDRTLLLLWEFYFVLFYCYFL